MESASVLPPSEEAASADANYFLQEGRKALRGDNFDLAIEMLGKALELRISVFGEMAPECATFYFKYGSALFYKAQAESDAFGGKMEELSKKAGAEPEDEAVDDDEEREEGADQNKQKNECQGEEEEADEESDMELAWKLLDVARLIHASKSQRSVEEADIIATLADISLEREDFATSLSDYHKALGILEQILSSHDRMLAELCFKICLAHQMAEQTEESLKFCKKAISICESRVELLKSESKAVKEAGDAENKPKNEKTDTDLTTEPVLKEIEEIETLLVDLKEKAEDLILQSQTPSLEEALRSEHPEVFQDLKSFFASIGKVAQGETNEDGDEHRSAKGESSSAFDAPQLTDAANGKAPAVKDLGVVGRGTKREASEGKGGQGTSQAAKDEGNEPKRRSLGDLMGGDEGGNGFGFQ